jgi:hypothetical protein
MAHCWITPIAATVIWWPLRLPGDSVTARCRSNGMALAGSSGLASVERVAGLLADLPREVATLQEMRGIGEYRGFSHGCLEPWLCL